MSGAEKKRKVVVILSQLPDRLTEGSDGASKSIDNETNPQQLLNNILARQGMKVEVHSSDSLPGFFSDPTADEIESYQSDIIQAVRSQDIPRLRFLKEQGRPLKCSNQFGESLLHLACRRGFLDVVTYLVDEAGVPLQVRDDYGRTPLHDALWSAEPNVELVGILVSRCPDLLYIKDRRGNTPLSFVRRQHWNTWNKFLDDCSVDTLLPKVLPIMR
jgi:hypothetical protein